MAAPLKGYKTKKEVAVPGRESANGIGMKTMVAMQAGEAEQEQEPAGKIDIIRDKGRKVSGTQQVSQLEVVKEEVSEDTKMCSARLNS